MKEGNKGRKLVTGQSGEGLRKLGNVSRNNVLTHNSG